MPGEIVSQEHLPALNFVTTPPDRFQSPLPSSGRAPYPALNPLLPYIRSFLSISQARSLLELYFTSAFNSNCLHPVCRHVHVHLFRKSSMLSPTNPRPCSPALLASMLWAAAETGGPDMLSWSYSKRRNVSRRLYILTLQLLRPLVHFDVGSPEARRDSDESQSEMTMYAFGRNKPSKAHAEAFLNAPPFAETEGSLDDVATYIHVASITSASEHKAASMRWWHAAFTLARELKFNKEAPGDSKADPSCPVHGGETRGQTRDADPWAILEPYNFDKGFDEGLLDFMERNSNTDECTCSDKSTAPLSEERREERRRIWWLLYIMDRHLALCYNRPLALLDAECEELMLPLDEASWQSEAFLWGQQSRPRPVFPSFECTGHNIFGFFLPLMTITREIIDLNHARGHPLLGLIRHNADEQAGFESEILRQLAAYQSSLHTFQAVYAKEDAGMDQSANQNVLHTKTVVAYATHITHVLHVLLSGKMDPMSLFQDEDFWTTTPSFISTMQHAVSAADAVAQILDLDPEISFIPYFFGIQLLQGSFVLLLAIDKLKTKTDPSIINACEVIIRATEACVATLDTEYQVTYPATSIVAEICLTWSQRNYRQILRSAVVQARGRYVPKKEAEFRRRAVLTLYRWTRNGTGLAV